MYADDIVIYKDLDLDTNPNDVQRVQQDITNITEWCQINELTINCKKTKAQFFKEQHTIKLQEQEVGYSDTFKYLGVEIDDLLSMKSHVNRVNKNASHKLFLLRKLRHVLNTHAATLVLKSMFLGVLDYGLLFTTVVPIKMFDDLQTIQNHALRSVLNVYDPLDFHVNQLHDIVGVKFLKHRMIIQLMMCIRNAYINKSLPVIQRNLVTRGNDGATFFSTCPQN